MVDKHDKIFFGQNSAVSVMTSSKEEPYFFLRCIKKKSDGSWEKPSKGEGRSVRLSLEELVSILRVLRGEVSAWNTTHSYKEQQTSITVYWSSSSSKEKKDLWIIVAEYKKMMNVTQAEVLKLLLEHILHEKIEFSTIQQSKKEDIMEEPEAEEIVEESPPATTEIINEELVESPAEVVVKEAPPVQNGKKSGKKSYTTVTGSVGGSTEKAIKVNLNKEGFETWIPKSVINSEYDASIKSEQEFSVELWWLDKKRAEMSSKK